MKKNYDKCTSFHSLVGVYEAITDLAVSYLQSDNEVMRKWYAEYVQKRAAELKADYNEITNSKKTSYDKV